MVTVTQAESGLTCSTSCGSYTYVAPTATPSATRTGSPTSSPTPSPVATAVLTATPTATSLLTPVPAPPTPLPADGSLEIEDHAAWPNPVRGGGRGFVSVKLKGRADSISVKVYTRSWICVAEAQGGPQAGGWARLDLPRAFLDAAPSDAYYYVVSAKRGGAVAPRSGKGTLQLLR